MAVHKCDHFCNNLSLPHDRAVRSIAKYPVSTCTYVDLPDRYLRLTTCGVVCRPNIGKVIECYVDDNFFCGWYQADADNAENSISHTGYIIMYTDVHHCGAVSYKKKSI